MTMPKNTAGYVTLFAFDSTTGEAKTGDAANMLFYYRLDNGTVTVLSSNSGVPTEDSSTKAPGSYTIAVTQAETNADKLNYYGVSTTPHIQIAPMLNVYTGPPGFNSLAIVSGIASADVKKTDGATYHNFDGTLAAVTAATDVTFPTTDAYGNSVPNDARYEYGLFRLVSSGPAGSAGQLLFTTAKTGTRKFGFLSAYTPIDPDNTSTYLFLGTWRADVTYINGVLQGTPGTASALVIAGPNAATTFATGSHFIGTVDTVTTVTNQLAAAAIATGVWQDAVGADFTAANSVGKSLYNAFASNTSVLTTASLVNAPTGGSAPTVSQIATAVWQDTTANDFTVASSIGKALYINNHAPGATSGLAIVGSKMDLVDSPNTMALASVADQILIRDWTATISAVGQPASFSTMNALRKLRNHIDTTTSAGFLSIMREDGTTLAYSQTIIVSAAAELMTSVG